MEAVEACILARQLGECLAGRRVESVNLRDYEKLQRVGFINRDLTDYERLVGEEVISSESRGNTIRVRLTNGMNLLIGPEYGGLVLLSEAGEPVPGFHFKAAFRGGSSLTVRLTSMGIVTATSDAELPSSYLYKRDFSGAPGPLDEGFTLEAFCELIARRNMQLKAALVGKEAVLMGVSNSGFQDIMFRAGLHPKRKTGELAAEEVEALHRGIRELAAERLRLGGKQGFTDIHGKEGKYPPLMGPSMKGRNCPRCGAPVGELALGGGRVFYCPGCQK